MKFKLLLLIIFCATLPLSAQTTVKRTQKLMGSRFEITVIASSDIEANLFIDLAVAEITRIERLISSWDPASQTSEINRNAGIKAVAVNEELFSLIDRCVELSKLTEGAFDISYASMDAIWKFDGTMMDMPSEKEIQASVKKVGFKNIVLDTQERTVFLKLTKMKIGFGGIGKGYAADMAKKLLIEKGVKGGIINASGDMNTWGKQLDGTPWKVAITNPLNKNKAFALLPIDEGAVVTSGNYEKFVTLNGRRFSHIIDPRTGYPSSGIISATVFAPKAELADALATSIFVMGIEAGLYFINQIPKIECILIDDNGTIFTSNNIELENKQ